jgi:hypothetical protein
MALINAGINLGFGFVKVATDNGEFRYASVVRERSRADPLSSASPAQEVKYGGQLYEVGEDAALYGGGIQLKALYRDWANSLAYQVLAQSVIDRLAGEGNQFNVVVGLALDHFKRAVYRQQVQQFWQRTWPTKRGRVNVKQATVVPEPLGSARILSADPDFASIIAHTDALLVDFGRLTTNWMRMHRGNPVPDQSGSVDCSVTAALDEATSKLAAALSRPQLDPVDVEMAWLDKTVILSRDSPRRPVKVGEAIKEGARRVWPSIEQALKNSVDARGMDVIVVGGGAIIFQELLKESLPESKIIVPGGDPQMINCRGFLKLAATQKLKPTSAVGNSKEEQQ